MTKHGMDGAVFQGLKNKTPSDYMDNEHGLRPGQDKAPWGTAQIDLRDGFNESEVTLPPRSVWVKGQYKGSSNPDWDIWVVSGEGTPGNYKTREYTLPSSIASDPDIPKHPMDWEAELKKKKTSFGGWGKKDDGPAIPWGVRIRCLGCGHFFKMDDLPNHAKFACPATQDPVLWIIECACHKDDLQAAATVLEGFPVKPPDTSGEKEDGAHENGGSAQPESAASTATG